MNIRTKIYLAIAATVALLIVCLLISVAVSNRKVAKLEQAIATSKQTAGAFEEAALTKEIEAVAYKQKIEYLEQQLTAIHRLATKQDEQLETLITNARGARSDVERARRTRAAAATAAELCQKLAQVGHPCD